MSFGAPTPPAGGSGSGVDATARAAAAAAQAAADEAVGIGEAAQATADSAHSGSAHDSTARAAAATADGKAVTAQAALSGSANDSTARAAAAAALSGSGNDSTARAAAATAQTAANKALTWRGLVARLTTSLTIAANTNTRIAYNSVVLDKSTGALSLGSGADAGKIIVGAGVAYLRLTAQMRWENTSNYRSIWIRQSRGGSVLEDFIGLTEEREPYASQLISSRPIAVQSGDTLEVIAFHQSSSVTTSTSITQYSVTAEIVE